jgi:hypothetical protein
LRTWRSGSSLDRKHFRKYDELETHGEKDTTPAFNGEGFLQGAIYIYERGNFNILVEGILREIASRRE